MLLVSTWPSLAILGVHNDLSAFGIHEYLSHFDEPDCHIIKLAEIVANPSKETIPKDNLREEKTWFANTVKKKWENFLAS